MGIIKQGILGGFKNKVGSVVGTSWKGRAVMKAMPLSVANPRTAGQVEQRTKFKAATQLGSQLLASVVKPLNDRFSGNISGYNAFVKRNVDNYNDVTNEWNTVSISKGKMAAPSDFTATFQPGGNIDLGWSTTLNDQYAMKTDKVYMAFIFKKDGKHIAYGEEMPLTTRDAGTFELRQDVLNETGDSAIISIAFLRSDGTVVSDSAAITVIRP